MHSNAGVAGEGVGARAKGEGEGGAEPARAGCGGREGGVAASPPPPIPTGQRRRGLLLASRSSSSNCERLHAPYIRRVRRASQGLLGRVVTFGGARQDPIVAATCTSYCLAVSSADRLRAESLGL